METTLVLRLLLSSERTFLREGFLRGVVVEEVLEPSDGGGEMGSTCVIDFLAGCFVPPVEGMVVVEWLGCVLTLKQNPESLLLPRDVGTEAVPDPAASMGRGFAPFC